MIYIQKAVFSWANINRIEFFYSSIFMFIIYIDLYAFSSFHNYSCFGKVFFITKSPVLPVCLTLSWSRKLDDDDEEIERNSLDWSYHLLSPYNTIERTLLYGQTNTTTLLVSSGIMDARRVLCMQLNSDLNGINAWSTIVLLFVSLYSQYIWAYSSKPKGYLWLHPYPYHIKNFKHFIWLN